jgi:NAD(P)-dependent dehydrogenase (short-subunit alcohol dehydrogenase family)
MQENGIHPTGGRRDLFDLGRRTIVCMSPISLREKALVYLIRAVTGGLGSLGVALTKTLLQYCADVVSMDLPPSASKDVWDPIVDVADEMDGQVKYISCDVTSEESVESAFSQAVKASRFPIRGLVTCAGISGRRPAIKYPVDEFRRIMDINVTGTFLCARIAARIMHEQNVSGSIVMFASMSGTNVNKVDSPISTIVLSLVAD